MEQVAAASEMKARFARNCTLCTHADHESRSVGNEGSLRPQLPHVRHSPTCPPHGESSDKHFYSDMFYRNAISEHKLSLELKDACSSVCKCRLQETAGRSVGYIRADAGCAAIERTGGFDAVLAMVEQIIELRSEL